MQGIHFVIDKRGEKIAVQLDLKLYGELWHDIYDQILLNRRKGEKRERFEVVEKRQVKSRKLRP